MLFTPSKCFNAFSSECLGFSWSHFTFSFGCLFTFWNTNLPTTVCKVVKLSSQMQRDINAAVILIQITHTALWVLYTYILLMMLTLSWLRNAVTAGFSPVVSSVCFAPAHSSVHMLLSLWDSDWCKTTRSSSSVSYFPPIPLFFFLFLVSVFYHEVDWTAPGHEKIFSWGLNISSSHRSVCLCPLASCCWPLMKRCGCFVYTAGGRQSNTGLF